jgi:DNA-binding SARP family transcriptional activator
VHVHLFGSIDIGLGDRRLDARSFGGRKPKQLLELLLVRRGHPVLPDELAEVLWPGDAQAGQLTTVQHYISVLRRRLGPTVLTSPAGYALDRSRFTLDLDRFDALVASVDSAPFHVRRALQATAFELVRGEVLADEPDAPWAVEVRSAYRRSHVRLLLQASAAALDAAEPQLARDLAAVAVTNEPYDEPSACLLMAAHYATGDHAPALDAFERCRRRLWDSLGVHPMPQTVDLQRAVLSNAPVAQVVAPALRMAQALSRPLGARSFA